MTNIQTINGYQTADGQKFHEITEAQTHARRALYGIVHDRAVAGNTALGILPRETVIDFLMAHGQQIASIALDPLEPADRRQPAVKPEEPPAAGLAGQRRAVAAALTAPPGKTESPVSAFARIESERRTGSPSMAMESAVAVPPGLGGRKGWPPHPLDNKPAEATEDDALAAMERELANIDKAS